MPKSKAIAYPALNAGACAHHGVRSDVIEARSGLVDEIRVASPRQSRNLRMSGGAVENDFFGEQACWRMRAEI